MYLLHVVAVRCTVQRTAKESEIPFLHREPSCLKNRIFQTWDCPCKGEVQYKRLNENQNVVIFRSLWLGLKRKLLFCIKEKVSRYFSLFAKKKANEKLRQ
jgi:hypothetical protein